jgi:hypothetical protein
MRRSIMTSIQLDPEAVAGIATAAIFDSLSHESRESIVKQAVEHLLTPEKSRTSTYGSVSKTPLQLAFDQAISQVAFKVVKEKIESDPRIQEKIEELLGPLLLGALAAESSQFDDELSGKIGEVLGMWIAECARERRR